MKKIKIKPFWRSDFILCITMARGTSKTLFLNVEKNSGTLRVPKNLGFNGQNKLRPLSITFKRGDERYFHLL